jgi:sugar phosphate isomerase/epimerase
LPYQGKIDWESVIEALREIGYEGHFTYEAGNFIRYYPEELLMLGLTHMEKVGRYFIKRITE